MSISTALSNAYSGLSAVSRAAETVSNNVSNALTEGYSRQEIGYSATSLGGEGAGVRVDSVARSTDVAGTAARQRAEAALASTSSTVSAMDRLTSALGDPGDPGALAIRFSDFENALSSAISAPDSTALQNGILTDAKALAGSFIQISTETTRIRVEADAEIARQVQIVNTSLKQIEGLNAEIRMLSMSGRGVANLEDQRQALVDTVNAIIPIKQSLVGEGQIALFTTGGEILLNDSAREVGFTQTAMMTPDMTLSSGALSGITVNGRPVEIGQDGGSLEGGSLAANFRIRDTIAPKFQQQIDALAQDLIERFQDPAVDPTLAAGAAGLFTDAGLPFDPLNEIGIAGRISINASVDPAVGGELWRLRDGIGAITPGLSGQSEHLIRMKTSMGSLQAAGAGMGLTTSMSASGFAEEITSFWALETNRNNGHLAQQSALFDTLRTSELNVIGVDTDLEMQNLLVVEQAYAANARVVSVIDRLMKTLLEM